MSLFRREPARPNTRGYLTINAEVAGERVTEEGDYTYIGRLHNGMLAFVPSLELPAIYLHPAEVVEFKTQR